MSRTWATTAVTILAVLIAVGAAMAILPPLFGQLQTLVLNVPAVYREGGDAGAAADRAAAGQAWIAAAQPAGTAVRSRATCRPGACRRSAALAGKVAQGGLALFNLLALLFLTPVVTFYLLRDWEKLLGAIDGALAARSCRHHPQARPPIERGDRRLRARPGPRLHLAGIDLRHRPVAGRPAVRSDHRADRRRHFLHPLRRHLRRRHHGARHGAGAISAGLDRGRSRSPPSSCSARRWRATCCRPSWSATGSACIRCGSCSPCWPADRCSASSAF